MKNLPAMQETWVWFLGREDPLEKEMATHSSITAQRIQQTEKPGRLRSMGSQESDTTYQLKRERERYMNLDDKARQHIKKKRQHLTNKGP